MSGTEVITRPNGKVWRGRKPIRTAEFSGLDGELGVKVGEVRSDDTKGRNRGTWLNLYRFRETS
jgi:hypothetical protein